ncbi:2-oxoacid:acceptor oxidoreductase family protein [candidate division WOR-3 bacterium]|nr:2-oxoacid:acceptor oxidoreductase family protein [candidate division WOR-3 bacterium]
MNNKMLNTYKLPYCKGCGHHLIARNTETAFEKLGIDPLNTILVTDIGCQGMLDRYSNTHTVHGLHGRSAALGAGISFGLSDPKKKIIIFIGDGGSTIGLQHILEAARLNLDMTVIIHNNMLYGMTGGQSSGFTPCSFNTTTIKNENQIPNYDICKLARSLNVNYVRRIIARGDFSEELKEAIGSVGFSLVEVVELCPSYGLKLNPGMKMDKLLEESGQEEGVWRHEKESKTEYKYKYNNPSLFEQTKQIEQEFEHNLKKPFSIIMAGSAGEGVQIAATFFANASIASGLSVNQKGRYPVTVGVGFSTAEIIVSPEEECKYDLGELDVIIITSKDGLENNRKYIKEMKNGILFIDKSLELPETSAQIISHDFRHIGAKSAAIYSLFFAIKHIGIITQEALTKTIKQHRIGSKIPLEKIKEELSKKE